MIPLMLPVCTAVLNPNKIRMGVPILKYKGKELWVMRENAQKLGRNEYFIADLIGLKVVEDSGKALGILKDVMETGANDVYVVEMERLSASVPSFPLVLLWHDCMFPDFFRDRTVTVDFCRMNFYVMTLFPEMVEQGMKTSILGRAMEKGLLSLEAVNIRDYTENVITDGDLIRYDFL